MTLHLAWSGAVLAPPPPLQVHIGGPQSVLLLHTVPRTWFWFIKCNCSVYFQLPYHNVCTWLRPTYLSAQAARLLDWSQFAPGLHAATVFCLYCGTSASTLRVARCTESSPVWRNNSSDRGHGAYAKNVALGCRNCWVCFEQGTRFQLKVLQDPGQF
jgi:hypothetical protein